MPVPAPRLDVRLGLLAAGAGGGGQVGHALLIPALAFGRLGLQWALACCSRASRPVGLASSAGSSSLRARPCWWSSAWSISAACCRIWSTSSWSLARVRLARSARWRPPWCVQGDHAQADQPAAAHSRSTRPGTRPARAGGGPGTGRWSRGRAPRCRPAPGRRGLRCSAARSAGWSAPRWRRRTAAPPAGSWGRRRAGRARRPGRQPGTDRGRAGRPRPARTRRGGLRAASRAGLGEQEGLVAVAAQEVVDHGAPYPFAPLAPNVLVLKNQRRSPDTTASRSPGVPPTPLRAGDGDSASGSPRPVQPQVADRRFGEVQAQAGSVAILGGQLLDGSRSGPNTPRRWTAHPAPARGQAPLGHRRRPCCSLVPAAVRCAGRGWAGTPAPAPRHRDVPTSASRRPARDAPRPPRCGPPGWPRRRGRMGSAGRSDRPATAAPTAVGAAARCGGPGPSGSRSPAPPHLVDLQPPQRPQQPLGLTSVGRGEEHVAAGPQPHRMHPLDSQAGLGEGAWPLDLPVMLDPRPWKATHTVVVPRPAAAASTCRQSSRTASGTPVVDSGSNSAAPT